QQSPKLVRVGKWNTSADADIFRRVLLKQISDDPHKAAKHQPEQSCPHAHEFMPKWRRAFVCDSERRHRGKLSNGKKSNERKRIHPRQIRFAVGNVHCSPKNPRAERGKNSQRRSASDRLMRRRNGKQSRARKHDNRSAENSEPALPSGIAE